MIQMGDGMLAGLVAVVGLVDTHVVMAFQVQAGEITGGRAKALVGVAVALISVVVGGIALARSAGRLGSVGSIIALSLGSSASYSAQYISGNVTGDFGSGGGRLGAIVALVLGLIGMVLGGLARARSSSR
jgi:hypothetical protein